MTLAERIRIARRKAGLSQQLLAESIGVSRSAIANWESVGNDNPAVANLILVATTTRVCFDWLATGRGEMQLAAHKYDSLVLDAELVSEPAERRLLCAWRGTPARTRRSTTGVRA